jgi:hypothetical protein
MTRLVLQRILTLTVLGLPLLAQSNVSGPVPLTLVDGGTDCGGLGRLVEIHANPSGLTGDGGAAAGLNGFLLVLEASRSGVLTSVLPGSSPIGWNVRVTEPPLTNQIRVAGWSTDMAAPNQSYHLATLVLTGTLGAVTLTALSSTELASRLVAPGNGPSLLSVSLPSPLNVTVPANYNLNLLTGISSWLQTAASYDLAAPSGPIDIRDLVKLVICTP